jgi:hypothetical protein
MRQRGRLFGLLVLLLAIGVARAGQQAYRWYAYQDERVAIGRLEGELTAAAVGVVSTQARGDTLRSWIEAADSALAESRRELDVLEQQVLRTSGASTLEGRYRSDLAAYNEKVMERNRFFQEWRETVAENHHHVDRFNLLGDSIRGHAENMGEPYYPISTPAEIANRSGLLPTP